MSQLVPGALAFSSLFDSSPAPDFYQEPGTAAGRALDVNAEGGEVVDPYSGMLELRYVDAKLIGTGPPIEVVRTYRPNRTPPGIVGTDYVGRRNAIGVGWDLHFGRVYQPRLRGCRPARVFADANPVVELADGTRKVFFLADANASGALPYDYISQDRWVARCSSAPSGGLIVYDPNGLVYTFATLGAVTSGDPFYTWSLTSVQDRNGNTLTFQYTTIGGLLLPAGVLASDGRQVTLTYTTLGSGQALLSTVVTPTGSTTFSHTLLIAASDHYQLTRVTGPADAGAPTFEYGYYGDIAAPGYNPQALAQHAEPLWRRDHLSIRSRFAGLRSHLSGLHGGFSKAAQRRLYLGISLWIAAHRLRAGSHRDHHPHDQRSVLALWLPGAQVCHGAVWTQGWPPPVQGDLRQERGRRHHGGEQERGAPAERDHDLGPRASGQPKRIPPYVERPHLAGRRLRRPPSDDRDGEASDSLRFAPISMPIPTWVWSPSIMVRSRLAMGKIRPMTS